MTIVESTLILSAFLGCLVAVFLFLYAIVEMPGIKNLNDKGFIKAFLGVPGVASADVIIFSLFSQVTLQISLKTIMFKKEKN